MWLEAVCHALLICLIEQDLEDFSITNKYQRQLLSMYLKSEMEPEVMEILGQFKIHE